MLIDVANTLIYTVPPYGEISNIPATVLGPPNTPESLTHIYCNMDNVILAVQWGPDCQHQFFGGTVRALKWIFPSLPGDLKDSVSVKNILA